MLRVVGPRVSAAQDEQVNFRHCTTCTPPPQVHTCILCSFATEEKWRYQLHNNINPETCQRTVRRKAKQWASKT